MKKLIALLAVALPLVGQAQPPEGQDWWACQSVAVGGLIWEKPSWRATRFIHDDRFILIGVNNTITEASAAKAMTASDVRCGLANSGRTYCMSFSLGTALSFNPATGNGAIAEIIGGTGSGLAEERDTLSTMAFECAKG